MVNGTVHEVPRTTTVHSNGPPTGVSWTETWIWGMPRRVQVVGGTQVPVAGREPGAQPVSADLPVTAHPAIGEPHRTLGDGHGSPDPEPGERLGPEAELRRLGVDGVRATDRSQGGGLDRLADERVSHGQPS
jgi:hypothetical protein